jgi:prepilin-type N-terminal cleavage/methylation domain-containing protein
MEQSQKKKGFTLVELIVVLVILAILMALIFPALVKYIDKTHKKVCELNKAGLLRDLTMEEVYDWRKDSSYDAVKLQELSNQSEYKCAQAGPYQVSRAGDGSIAIVCKEHDTDYNFNMNEALEHVMGTSEEVAELIKKYANEGKKIDSASNTGKAYSQILEALNIAGFNVSKQGVQTWSLQGIGSGNYYFYWTTEDIASKKVGDQVKVMRYNSARGTYTAGFVSVTEETLSASDSTDGKSHKYNVIGRGDRSFSEYKTDEVSQSDADKKNYSSIYDVFNKMPAQPETKN